MSQTTGDIAARLGGTLIGDPVIPIHGAGTLQDGQPGEIGFLAENHYRKYLADTTLSAVLVAEAVPDTRAAQIIVADVKRAWRELAESFAPRRGRTPARRHDHRRARAHPRQRRHRRTRLRQQL